nr:hirudin variant HV1(VV) [Hirudo medicinalis]ALA22950.1 hirudin variant HV1(VV) 1 [Hirudo medicinalis]ALA22951.1 hirudin variant HV1(VV) 2 [Hirudo medicinalis]ALA22952.1 hirudin variant HV1(VV) [Hirudo medicinalis]APA20854.1 hirudin variant HV1-VV [Hirudo verbana]
MFSLKLFVVFLAVCICVSQAVVYTDCTESGQNLCLCEDSNVCGQGNKCILGSNGEKNQCVTGEGTPKPQSHNDGDFEEIPEEYLQ